jgi:protein involved in ribonucleotide reduction
MFVLMNVNFNGNYIPTSGKVVKELENDYLVDFENQGVQFRGLWPKSYCVI